MLLNKTDALLEWCKGFDDTLKLNAVVTEDASRSLVIEPSTPVEQFIDGTGIYSLTFSLVGMCQYSAFSDDVNQEAQKLMNGWHDWITLNKDNPPDFGEAVIESIKPITTAPTLAMVYNQDLAKYQFSAEIIYSE